MSFLASFVKNQVTDEVPMLFHRLSGTRPMATFQLIPPVAQGAEGVAQRTAPGHGRGLTGLMCAVLSMHGASLKGERLLKLIQSGLNLVPKLYFISWFIVSVPSFFTPTRSRI